MESGNRIIFQKYIIRKASITDASCIWELLSQGILKRKAEGSNQWQDGYPNEQVVQQDIANGHGYVVINEYQHIVGYFALIFEKEPAYEEMKTDWLSNDSYAVIHRMATDQHKKVKGLASWMLLEIERIVRSKGINSIKVDTNYDNEAMLYLFTKLNYVYCGEVFFRGSPRKAFQKII